MNNRQVCVVSLVATLIITLSVSAVFAQSRARVYEDHTPIWRIDVPVVAATVPAGTVLDIVGRTGTGTFFKVVIPEQFGGHGEIGLIAASSIVLVPGSGDPPVRRGSSTVKPPPTGSSDQRASPDRTPRGSGEPGIAVRGFGQGGLMVPSAQESFQAVAGQTYAFTFGGGAQLRFRNGIFIEGSLDQFRQTGERVFVYDDTVFPLGIPNTMTVRPLLLTAGYRFGSTRPVVPYLGGGIGLFHLTESTPFSEEGEGLDEKYTGYRMSGGVEFRSSQWVGTAIEATYTRVPDSLGVSGVSQVFGERDLGGFEFRVKVLFGR
jgi:opacity protein-like surface antigen